LIHDHSNHLQLVTGVEGPALLFHRLVLSGGDYPPIEVSTEIINKAQKYPSI